MTFKDGWMVCVCKGCALTYMENVTVRLPSNYGLLLLLFVAEERWKGWRTLRHILRNSYILFLWPCTL